MAMFTRTPIGRIPTRTTHMGTIRRRRPGSGYASALARANAANERRYQDILAGYQTRESAVMGLLDQMGTTQAANIQSAARQSERQSAAELTARGLAGTTIMPSMRAGIRARAARSMADLGVRTAVQRASLLSALRGDMLQFMERRTDAGPSTGAWANALQALGYGLGRRGI